MAIFQKRFASFGREDRALGLRAILKADNFVLRLVAFIIFAGLFYLIVQWTYKDTHPSSANDSTAAPAATTPSK